MIDRGAIFLDFDGIILESVDVKGWAFGKLFEEYPQHTEEIIRYHLAHGGVPRFTKIRYIYKEILNEPLPEDKYQLLCQRYSEIVFNRVLACDFVPGALEFLKKYHSRIPLFIVSGTPQEEMVRVIQTKELDGYFQGVYGSPDTKGYWTQKILEEANLQAEDCFWVGDAQSDLKAANQNKVKFIGRIIEDNDIFAGQEVYRRIKDLFELDHILQEHWDSITK